MSIMKIRVEYLGVVEKQIQKGLGVVENSPMF